MCTFIYHSGYLAVTSVTVTRMVFPTHISLGMRVSHTHITNASHSDTCFPAHGYFVSPPLLHRFTMKLYRAMYA